MAQPTIGDFTAGSLPTSASLYVETLLPDRPYHRTIIMVHGSMHTGGCYLSTADGGDGWAQVLAQAGYRVLVVHWLGSRAAGQPKGPLGSGEEVCHALGRLIGSIEGQVDLLVHSMSGPFGFRLVETHGNRIATLVAVAPGQPGNIQPVPKVVHEDDNTITIQLGDRHQTIPKDCQVPPYPEAILRYTHSARFPQHAIEDYVATLVSVHSRFILERVNVNGSQLCVRAAEPFANKPVLVITGSDDTLHPREVDERTVAWLADMGASVEFLYLPDLDVYGNGHMMMVEDNSEDLAKMIDHWIRSPH